MLIFTDISSIKSHLNKLKKEGNIIGFVPTMGALHNGHLSLVKKSILESNITVVSIFVNPTQFDNSEDLRTYPSNIKNDISLIKSISNEIILFNPDSDEIYSDGIKSHQFNFNGLDRHMEGKFRQNHFHGVATVVNKLLSIVEPDNIYFGEKDFQQLRIIENLVFEKKVNTQENLFSSLKILSNNENYLSVIYEKSKVNMKDLIQSIETQGVNIIDISTDDGDLEDVFLTLTKN